MHVLNGHTEAVLCCQVTEDGRYLASGSHDRSVKIWDMDTGECLHTLQEHTGAVQCMALKGTTLVTGSWDGTLRVWDVEMGERLHVLIGHLDRVQCIQFDGERAVSGADDHTVKVWDVGSGRCIQTLTGHTKPIIPSLLFDSQRNIVISGSEDRTIRIWDISSTGQCQHTLMFGRHEYGSSGVVKVEMDLRGEILVSVGRHSTVKVWNISDLQDVQCVFTLYGHSSGVTVQLHFLDNGLLLSSSEDGTVKLWNPNQGTFVRDLVQLENAEEDYFLEFKASPTTLLCGVESERSHEDMKLIIIDFNADFP